MPVYYFDVLKGGVASSLGEGVDFPSDELAHAYALGIISTFQSGVQGSASERISIRDETGTPINEVGQDDLRKGSKPISGLPNAAEPESEEAGRPTPEA